jgi:catechol 2,3-dioxygenase-like lactoylglutathione lyase family enzyme
MAEPAAAVSHFWYMRPVFFVADIQRSIDFYVDKLGFRIKWHKETVCQVDRGEGEIILCQSADRTDKGRLFIELKREGFDQMVRETTERRVLTQKTWWGYDAIQINDPDGNELLFPYE